jgi:beta-lactamase regulating signal transducer with metallopeptidase domain
MTGEILSAGYFLWSCLWQSTIFLIAGLLVSFLLRRHSAKAHRVLLLAMIAAIIVPAARILVKHYDLGIFIAKPAIIQPPSEFHVIHEATDVIPDESIEHSPASINRDSSSATTGSDALKFPRPSVLLYAWIAVSLILIVRLLVTFIIGTRLLRRAMPLDCDKIEQAIDRAKTKLGINKQVKICTSAKISSPVIWCWRSMPVLLVPSATGLPDIDWTGVLCHELAHYKRRDHIAGLLAELMVCLLPWQPLLWLAKSRLISLSEQACDDWVVASGQSGTDYAESLLNLTPEVQMAFVPAVVTSKKGLPGRVRRILKDSCGNPRTGAAWVLASSVIAICLAAAIAFAQTKPAGLTGTVKIKLGKSAVIEKPAFPVTTIKGRILDPNNNPANGAHIVALPVTSWGYYIEPRNRNKEGYFELSWSPTWIEKGQSIYLVATCNYQQANLAAIVELNDSKSLVTVRLEPAANLVMKVVDPNDRRIEKYRASLSAPVKFKCKAPIFETTVFGIPNGYIFSTIPYGSKYKLTIRADDYQTKELTVDATDRSKEIFDLGTITLQPQDHNKPVVAEKGPNPDLAKEFHDIYRLNAEEVLKFIESPFVLGRQEYMLATTPSYASFALEHRGYQYGFHWDGGLKAYSAYDTNSAKLWSVLRLVLDIPVYEFSLPEELNVHVPYGDWIVRNELPIAEKLKALEDILHAELHRAIHFERRTAERDVIVVHGRYKFKPHPSGKYPDYIPVTPEDQINKSAKIKTANSLPEFLSHLESSLEIKVADETEPMEKTTIRYRQSGERLGWIKYPEERRWKINSLLDNLAKTTSLQLKLERRPAQMWVVSEKTKTNLR